MDREIMRSGEYFPTVRPVTGVRPIGIVRGLMLDKLLTRHKGCTARTKAVPMRTVPISMHELMNRKLVFGLELHSTGREVALISHPSLGEPILSVDIVLFGIG